MASKIHMVDKGRAFWFFCPGCQNTHEVNIVEGEVPCWAWNGSRDATTISPSYLISIPAAHDHRYPALVCHSFIRDGRIEYLSDCTHHLSGQTVDLPDWEE